LRRRHARKAPRAWPEATSHDPHRTAASAAVDRAGAQPIPNRFQLAIVGFGRLGAACAAAIVESTDFALVGVVRREPHALPASLRGVRVATHIRDLGGVQGVLLCVPPSECLGAATGLVQSGFRVVECARLEGHAAGEYRSELDRLAHRHRVPVVVGAGWDPGVVTLLHRVFSILIPRGQTVVSGHPGTSLHHEAALAGITGVQEALTGETRGTDGLRHRYVYLRLARGADVDGIRQSILGDPLFAGEDTQVFEMPDLAPLESPEGLVLERRATSVAGEHASLAFDARFDAAAFAAHVMLDAARALPHLPPGAHAYAPTPGARPDE
jgi:diaminopimelate dehydrogenase